MPLSGGLQIARQAADPGQRAGHAAGLLVPGQWPNAGTITTSDPGSSAEACFPWLIGIGLCAPGRKMAGIRR